VLAPAAAGSGGASGASGLSRVDPQGVQLLADIERDLKRDPPAEARGLVTEFRRGASRAQLLDYVRQHFPQDMALRAVALRWIDRVRPGADAKPTNPSLPGAGGGASWVAPISKH
jgi:hypothetical protein